MAMIARLLLLALLFGRPAFAADDGLYLFDLLKQPPYLAAWNGKLDGATVPGWVESYASTFDGPSSPSKAVTVGGQAYTLGWMCKKHDCGDNQLNVLFAPGGTQAWGLLTASGQQQWLGNPDAAIQQAILDNVE